MDWSEEDQKVAVSAASAMSLKRSISSLDLAADARAARARRSAQPSPASMSKKGMKTMATKAMKSATKTSAMKTMATKGTQTRRTWKWKSLSPRLTVRGDEDDEGHEVAQRRGQEEGSAVWLPEVVLGWEPIIVGWFWAPSGRPKFKYVMIEKESVEL